MAQRFQRRDKAKPRTDVEERRFSAASSGLREIGL
jgi:hypothetical protein